MFFSKATVILRGYNFEQVETVLKVLDKRPNVKNVEVTLNTPDAIEIIKKSSKTFGDRLNIGAGTVLNYDELVKAIDAGAKFALSPNKMTKQMIDYCKVNSVLAIPGAYTPSEIFECFEDGADIVKVFPANELSISYAKKVCEPLGDLKLMAVGGVNKSNVKEYLSSGYSYVGSAGGIFRRDDILNQKFKDLTQSLIEFEEGLSD